tara:strand:- start:306 stop:1598 length:1293 start_codon:yes stop_codon:yes gene_type:complete
MHNEIKCPHCNTAFKIDETGYVNILQQVRDAEFEQQIKDRLLMAEREKQTALELSKSESTQEKQLAISEKENKIQELQGLLDAANATNKLALMETNQLKEQELQELKSQIREFEGAKKLEVALAVSESDKKLQAALSEVEKKELEKIAAEKSLKERYETQLADRDAEIQRIQDFRAKLSTKMLGETLEQHCELEFNRARSMAFPNAYFEKDNDASSGSKGDYIFKEVTEEGIEIVSIMFEMKNEGDETATKKKNVDFLKELDKDRTEKGCEFAVLVSVLEADSDYYNDGIVDVSHKYPKMYVIRPQFFLQLISLLRNAAMGALDYKQELALVRAQTVDVTRFEDNLETFKTGFQRNYTLATNHFSKSIDEIDKSISHLTKTRESLQKSMNQLRLSNDKLQDVSVKKLTNNNPTMAAMFYGSESDRNGSED